MQYSYEHWANQPPESKESSESSTAPEAPSFPFVEELKELEERKMVTRHAYVEKPPRVEYQLTARALKALPILDLLQEYGQYLATEEGCM